ncbi:MAG: tRNA (guanosine(37)-N1)-methyltransferase TrmD [Deltaproteobacteria bacterium]|nr:MAG: tRNA (guanosine(37)-N1)-methyltransferase TrmD [Deltaproteobacteria bacterium]HEX16015.1 tRNA (guanosine(37)-N1)-methyltransferase TrmD [Deltaproteobacteria bacterium]
MTFDVLTLFPDLLRSPLEVSVLGKAIQRGVIRVNLVNIRDFAEDKHKVTDDYPYGGGRGMVMKPEPVVGAIRSVLQEDPRAWMILLTPQGVTFDQRVATRLATFRRVSLVCGRYEGVDERVRAFVNEELSIGDYVLSGGELAALVVIEAVSRLVPGVLGCPASPEEDSFSRGLLEHPQYTRPPEFEGMKVPEVLLSGDHGRIHRWRRRESLLRTWVRRPELLERAELNDEERAYLKGLEDGL